nr:MAG TPA: hypothetical protein [Caudoviricetes sp.]
MSFEAVVIHHKSAPFHFFSRDWSLVRILYQVCIVPCMSGR